MTGEPTRYVTVVLTVREAEALVDIVKSCAASFDKPTRVKAMRGMRRIMAALDGPHDKRIGDALITGMQRSSKETRMYLSDRHVPYRIHSPDEERFLP